MAIQRCIENVAQDFRFFATDPKITDIITRLEQMEDKTKIKPFDVGWVAAMSLTLTITLIHAMGLEPDSDEYKAAYAAHKTLSQTISAIHERSKADGA